MREPDFQPGFPGRIEATSVQERDGLSVRTVSGLAFVPNPLPPNLDRTAIVGRMYDMLESANTGLLRLEGLVDQLPDPNLLLRAMRTREAQASSRIENTIASVQDIALTDADVPPSEQSREVWNNRAAIEHGLQSTLPISPRLLLEMHAVLLDGVRGEDKRPGRWRDRQVYIGGGPAGFADAKFVPPPHGPLMEKSLHDWMLFMNPGAHESPARERWPYLIELAFSHYQFETIHPFNDGNGRLGRAIINLAPIKHGKLRYPVCNVSEELDRQRDEYYARLLRVSTHGEWAAWAEFFVRAIGQQSAGDYTRAQRVLDLYTRYHRQLQSMRANLLTAKLLDRVFNTFAIKVPEAAKLLEVSYVAAQRHVDRLVKIKAIAPLDQRTYDRVYVARDLIKLVHN